MFQSCEIRHNGKEMSIKKLCLLNFEDETNLIHVDQIDIEFATKSAIKT